MRRALTVLAAIVGVLAVVVGAAAVAAVRTVRAPFPDVDGQVAVPGLAGEVEVFRDARGVAQIYADTAEDLFRAQGYVAAQDRFWEMDVRRHVTAGRLSELFGADQVDTDTFLRTLGWHRVAEREVALVDPASRRYLEAYAAGVNAYVAGRDRGDLALQYSLLGLTGTRVSIEAWTPADSLAWLKAIAWDLRSNVQDETTRTLLARVLPAQRLAQLYPDYPYDRQAPIVTEQWVDRLPASAAGPGAAAGTAATTAAPAGPALPAGAAPAVAAAGRAAAAVPPLLGSGSAIGSNSWAVAGEHTASGRPLLANDPHLATTLPSSLYQTGLHCRELSPGCPFEVSGFGFAGLPGVLIGRTDRSAWGLTTPYGDAADLFVERVRGEEWLSRGEWRPLGLREEVIEVAGEEPVRVMVRSTAHGPLVSDPDDDFAAVGEDTGDRAAPDGLPPDEDYAVALRWTALEPGRSFDALMGINAARDWTSFRAAAALLDVPSQNLVYADVDGTIGYQLPGKFPVRSGFDGSAPAIGWTGEQEWTGYLPFDVLPSATNPAEGFVVTANNAIVGPRYPYPLTTDWGFGFRAQRLRDLLGAAVAGGGLTVDDMAALQRDAWSANAAILVPELLAVQGLSGYYGDGQDLLRDWDYVQDEDSAAAAYFNAVWSALLRLTFWDELPADLRPVGNERWFEVVRGLLPTFDDAYWDDVRTETVVETKATILRLALVEARDDLTRRLGKRPQTWSWGRLHQLELRDGTLGESGVGPVEALLNRGPYAAAGGSGLVNATSWDAAEGYGVVAGPVLRVVADLAAPDGGRWVGLTGTSGHAFHEHYTDQVEAWRTGATYPWVTTAEAVRRSAQHTLVLVPED